MPIEDDDVQQGAIFWLPSKESLPRYAVRRAHGKGAIEDGIFQHPVVIISRPKEERQIVHFNLITSFQGRRLEQVFRDDKDCHVSRRTWYLPIAPTPSHPDALSNKTKKRFPTLELADGAVLQRDSYVNIRDIYKIDWSLLKVFQNPLVPEMNSCRFARGPFVRMLAKCKTLTSYEAAAQLENWAVKVSKPDLEEQEQTDEEEYSVDPNALQTSDFHQSDFRRQVFDIDRKLGPPPKVPPDSGRNMMAHYFGTFNQSTPKDCKPMLAPAKSTPGKRVFNQIWIDVKGLTAVFIASI